jgi:hypothetical protein
VKPLKTTQFSLPVLQRYPLRTSAPVKELGHVANVTAIA